MKFTTAEYGAFWVWEAEDGPPQPVRPRMDTSAEFAEILPQNLSALAAVMDAESLENARSRLAGGRRCFSLQKGGEVICYGWVTQGRESAGELEREFNLAPEETYIWDCITLPEWRSRGCYSALLNRILLKLHSEGVPRVWIGAARKNRASIQGIAKAGFRPVVHLNYRRIWVFVCLSLWKAPQAPARLAARAAEILLRPEEIRIGRFAFGLRS